MVTNVNLFVVTFVIKELAMKERLIQLLDLEQLSPSKFADIIGVQRSSISHVISGRNKPSFDFLQKTLKAFPGLNASWLMLGEGTMYEQMGRNVSGNLFDTPSIDSREAPIESSNEPPQDHQPDRMRSEIEEEPSETRYNEDDEKDILEQNSSLSEGFQDKASPEKSGVLASTEPKRIVQVMVIYDDDTFRAFSPAH
jgi:transcriptional regulator with XRE-family HTH domain